AARRVEADGVLHHLFEALQLLGRARLIDLHAVFRLVVAVDQHGGAHARDVAARRDDLLRDAVDLPVARARAPEDVPAAPAFARGDALVDVGQVRLRAGHAGDAGPLLGGRLLGLVLAAQGRLHRLVVLFGALARGLVEVDVDAHVGAAGARHPLEQRAHVVLHVGRDLARLLALALLEAAHRRVTRARAVQRHAVRVDDADPILRQAGHGRAHEVHDARDLALAELHPGPELDHHRRRGALAARREQPALGQHQVHAGRRHALDRHDRARELALQGAAQVDLLLELGGAEAGAVEDLEAHAAPARQPGGGQVEAQLVHAVLRHLDAGRRDAVQDL